MRLAFDLGLGGPNLDRVFFILTFKYIVLNEQNLA
jgi:hypothetical protein